MYEVTSILNVSLSWFLTVTYIHDLSLYCWCYSLYCGRTGLEQWLFLSVFLLCFFWGFWSFSIVSQFHNLACTWVKLWKIIIIDHFYNSATSFWSLQDVVSLFWHHLQTVICWSLCPLLGYRLRIIWRLIFFILCRMSDLCSSFLLFIIIFFLLSQFASLVY